MGFEKNSLAASVVNFDGYAPCNRHRVSDIKRVNVYSDIINRIGCCMFKWNLPAEVLEDVPSDCIERAINCGVAVLYKVPDGVSVANSGRWACTPLEYIGPLRNDGTSDKFITRGSDYAIESTQLERYVIIKNNDFLLSEYDVSEWFAEMLGETDTSENRLIKWSRITPIGVAGNSKDAAALSELLEEVYNGKPWKVYSDGTKIATGAPTSRDDRVLRLTDDSAIERMHFLSEFHYELIRRICNLYNIPFHTSAKSAQNLESELHNTDIFSQMLTLNREECRKRAAEEMPGVLGFNEASVELSKPFKKENEVIENIIDSTEPAETSEEPAKSAEPQEKEEQEEGGDNGN